MKYISSHSNPFFKELLKLASSARQRRKAQQTLLEGAHLLQAYHASGNQQSQHLLVTEAAVQNREVAELLYSRSYCITSNPNRIISAKQFLFVAGRHPGSWQSWLHIAFCCCGRLRCSIFVQELRRCMVAQGAACWDGWTFCVKYP